MPYRVGHGNAGLTGGEFKLVTPADPALGSQHATIIVPSGKLWRPIAFTLSLTTDATVVDRASALIINAQGGTGTVASLRSATGESKVGGASSTNASVFLAGAVGVTNDVGSLASIPEIMLLPGWGIRNFIASLQAGDQISDVRLLVEEWEGV